MAAKTVVEDLSSDAGINWQFKPEGGQWKRIAVPAGGWRAQGYDCDAGTYRATIPIPRSAAGKTLHICFAAANFAAEVLAGPDEDGLERVATHVNGWMPFWALLAAPALSALSLFAILKLAAPRGRPALGSLAWLAVYALYIIGMGFAFRLLGGALGAQA